MILALTLVPSAVADAQTKRAKPKPKRPDLVVSFVGSPPASLARGNSFPSSVTVRNRGKVTASVSTARFYLSRDARIGRGDVRLVDTAIRRLRATRQATKRVRPRIPAFVHEAAYRVIACANRPVKLKESSQRNNCRVARRPVFVSRPGGPATLPPSVPGGLSISPATQSFGAVGVGAMSGTVVFTVTNTGSSSTGRLGTSMVGTDAAQFVPTADTCAGVSLSAGGTCSITVRFGPTSTGDKFASLQVSAAPGGNIAAQLSGIGLTPAQLGISANSHNYGNVSTAAPSEPVTFTITNSGQAPSGALTTTLGGADSGQFTITSDTCNNATVAGGGTCTVSVRFTPNSAGAKSATLTVSGTPGGSVAANLSGGGTTLSITPASHSFDATGVGSTSGTQAFTVRNVGSSPQLLTTVTVPPHFSKTADNCTVPAPVTLAANGTCQITIAFQPSSAGAKSGSLDVGSATGGTVSAALTGTGLTPATLTMTPASDNFGRIVIGQTSPPSLFTVTNTGQVTSSALTVAPLGGTDPGQFDIVAGTSPCNGVTLAPNATCIVRVTFSPLAPAGLGDRSALVQVSAAQGGTVQATVSGEGTALTISPASSGQLTPGGSEVFRVTNTATTATTSPIAISFGGGDAVHFTHSTNCSPTVSLGAGMFCDVTVTFSPTQGTTGARVATLNVSGGSGYNTSATVSGTS